MKLTASGCGSRAGTDVQAPAGAGLVAANVARHSLPPRSRSRRREFFALLVLLVAVAACGSRASEAQRQSLLTQGGQATAGLGSGTTSSELSAESATDATGARRAEGAGAVEVEQAQQESGLDTPAANAERSSTPRTASDVGITSDVIRLGHVTTLSGPVPGLFQGSMIGLQAFVAYQNAQGGIGGRKLEAVIRDDKFDSTAHRDVTRDLLKSTFALVGGISLFDDAAAADVKASGIPDIQTALTDTRYEVPNNFSPSPNEPGAALNPLDWLKVKYPDSIGAIGTLYGDIPASKRVHQSYRRGGESLGLKYVYERGYQATETDFTADIIRMRQSGVKVLLLIAVDGKNVARILKAAAQQNYEFDVVFTSSTVYDPSVLTLAGDAAEGVKFFMPSPLYAGEEANVVPEVKLMNEWIAKVRPGYRADTFAHLSWAAARLFADAMAKVGPNPTRTDVVNALRSIDKFTANGLLAETSPAGKRAAVCHVFGEIKDGKYRRIDPVSGFRCGPGYLKA